MMASHPDDAPAASGVHAPADDYDTTNLGLEDDDEANYHNPHASSHRWRHQESTRYAHHEKRHNPHVHQGGGPIVARDADSRGGGVSDLADFFNKSRIEPPPTPRTTTAGAGEGSGATHRPITPRYTPILAGGEKGGKMEAEAEVDRQRPPPDGREVVCGPLLNYRRMEGDATWVGSVLVVVAGGGRTRPTTVPVLELTRAGEAKTQQQAIQGVCLYSDVRNTFWRFDLAVEMEAHAETAWEYELPGLRLASKTKPRVSRFYVPARDESMRIMFHSCNGFSVGTDEAAWSGPALWNDVMRRHRERPFHVMIGGGDQIYNDGIRVSGPLRPWSDMGNPKKRKDYPFSEDLRQDCDDYYLKNYIRWYSTEPFAAANGQIPQLNIWDDHDIIDGFGSYVNEFMKCDVFRGIGGTAHKYYMLFQHHLPPPPSTYTSDFVPTDTSADGQGVDPQQVKDTYVHPRIEEPNYIYGPQSGPYVAEHSHNMFARLGARIAFLGIDARTERTRHQVNYPETYNAIFTRLKQELSAAASAGRPFRHLILLLGIPIAYPRLTWLENIFASPLMGPIKLLNRRLGVGGSFFNKFDGSVDLLDDLDDHYTARTHKKERNWLIEKLQGICAEFSIRTTILGGDVHLAALGRFYANPRLGIPVEHDYRYIVNVISSAIVNKPPPAAVANLLSARNKIHHLNRDTDETLLKLFDREPGESAEAGANHRNHVTMPRRNFATLTENSPNNAAAPVTNGTAVPSASRDGAPGTASSITNPAPSYANGTNTTKFTPPKDPRLPLHAGESSCGTLHRAARLPTSSSSGQDQQHDTPVHDGSLDVCICIEIDQHDAAGHTQGYGLTIPALEYAGPRPASLESLQLQQLQPPRRLGSASAGSVVSGSGVSVVSEAEEVGRGVTAGGR